MFLSNPLSSNSMRILSSILNEITAIEVEVSNGIASTRISKARYSLKNSAVILREIDDDKQEWTKGANGVAVLFITGNDVGSKEFDITDDEAIKKITENNNLLWTISEKDGNRRIDFIRKSSLENVWQEIGRKGFYITDITVTRQEDNGIHTTLEELYEKKLNTGLVKKSKEFRAFFFDSLFDKIKLPVLLFFFVLLFINYIAFSNIRGKYEISETAYHIELQRNKQEAENSEKANRLFSAYNNTGEYSLALMSDRIACYIPADMRLTSMVFFPDDRAAARGNRVNDKGNVIIVKGKSSMAGTVLLFAQHLQEDNLFGKVDIITINNLKESSSYDFELQIIL